MQRTTMAPRRPRFDVTSLGETMLRLSAPEDAGFAAASTVALHVGGAESNVCSTLAQLGRRCGWYGRLPRNLLGDRVTDELSRRGIDVSAVDRPSDGRVGLYFVDSIADRFGRTVVYDRAGSTASRMRSESVPWAYLTDTRLMHLTGITPALSPECAAVAADAVGHAKAAGVAVGIDVNYRRQLWDAAAARAALEPLVRRVDLLICAGRDAREVFALGGDDETVLRQLAELSGATWVVLTLGDAGVLALSPGEMVRQAAVPARVVDTIGAGDALAAGVIDGWLDGSLREGLRRGVRLAALALGQAGDMPIVTRAELIDPMPSS